MVFSGGWFSGHKSHSHFDGALIELSQHPFAVTFLAIVLPVVGVLRALGQQAYTEEAKRTG